jgi:uncharacterized protein (TIGR02246 family)
MSVLTEQETLHAIHMLTIEFARHVRERDAERLVDSFYAPDAKLLAPGMPMIEGRDAILAFWQGVFARGLQSAQFKRIQAETEGELACEVGRYTVTIENEPGHPVTSPGKYMVMCRRQADGHWRVIADIYNNDAA